MYTYVWFVLLCLVITDELTDSPPYEFCWLWVQNESRFLSQNMFLSFLPFAIGSFQKWLIRCHIISWIRNILKIWWPVYSKNRLVFLIRSMDSREINLVCLCQRMSLFSLFPLSCLSGTPSMSPTPAKSVMAAASAWCFIVEWIVMEAGKGFRFKLLSWHTWIELRANGSHWAFAS